MTAELAPALAVGMVASIWLIADAFNGVDLAVICGCGVLIAMCASRGRDLRRAWLRIFEKITASGAAELLFDGLEDARRLLRKRWRGEDKCES